MDSVLEIDSLSCGYKNGFKIENISLKVGKGDFIGVLGPNGSGKTTLFKAIAGDLPFQTGSVKLLGKSMNKYSNKVKSQHLSVVSQFMEFSNISVEDYVLMGRLPYRGAFDFFDSPQDIEIAHRYMNLTKIYHLRHKNMVELSGGEQQMANIASALCQMPELILLDEPISHLDITHQMQFMDTIQQLNEELKLSVVIILHDLNVASEYCRSLLLMKKGQILYRGVTNTVLTRQNIEQVYGAKVLVQTNPLSGNPLLFPLSAKHRANK
ncbi:MAG: hypothetical protein CSA89_00335 [Bacteroidales bacterium]|nr:MAG: hypothetical protein CSA89_00335 [Bacteroidales bacterium]